MGWKQAGAILPIHGRQVEAVEQVIQAAEEHARLGPVSRKAFRHEVRNLTSPRQRWLAATRTPVADPAYDPLMALLDGLLVDQGVIVTKHGIFTQEDLGANFARIERDGGREVIRFPYSQPWATEPDPGAGEPGVPGTPLYRSRENKPIEFERPARREREWWEEEVAPGWAVAD